MLHDSSTEYYETLCACTKVFSILKIEILYFFLNFNIFRWYRQENSAKRLQIWTSLMKEPTIVVKTVKILLKNFRPNLYEADSKKSLQISCLVSMYSTKSNKVCTLFISKTIFSQLKVGKSRRL